MSQEFEEVWTFDYDPLTGQTAPIRTKCTAGMFGYPCPDVDGRTMYENTHFRTEGEAWSALIRNATGHMRQLASEYRNTQRRMLEITDELAKAAAFTSEVLENHRTRNK